MDRPVPVDELEESCDELVSLEVGELTKRDAAAEMLVAVGIAARAAQRALTSDFDR
jgi:hypothetical protein